MKLNRPKVNDASLCRLKGWRVGTTIKAEPTARLDGGRVRYAKVTAIGEDSILVREWKRRRWGPERRWARKLIDYAMTEIDAGRFVTK